MGGDTIKLPTLEQLPGGFERNKDKAIYLFSVDDEPCKSCNRNAVIQSNFEPKDAEKQTDYGDDSCGHFYSDHLALCAYLTLNNND